MTKEEIIAAALKVLAPSEDEEDCRERVSDAHNEMVLREAGRLAVHEPTTKASKAAARRLRAAADRLAKATANFETVLKDFPNSTYFDLVFHKLPSSDDLAAVTSRANDIVHDMSPRRGGADAHRKRLAAEHAMSLFRNTTRKTHATDRERARLAAILADDVEADMRGYITAAKKKHPSRK